jgi:hypothetical protein
MNSIAHRIWKRFGLEEVTSLTNGFTMFRFKTEDDLQKVIGCLVGKPLFFRNDILGLSST